MKYVKLISLLSLSALLHGCASDSALQLNNPDKAQLGVDLANLLPPREIPYEVQQVGDIQVAYNMFFVKSDNLTGHRLTLAFRNTGKSEIIVTPELLVRDAGGFIYQPYNYAAFVAEAANLAGTQIPQVTIAQQSTYYSSGTVRDSSTGRTFNYSGQTTSTPSSSFASGFAQGMAQGAAIRAANDRKEGQMMLRWANAFWLKSRYVIPAGSAVSGALFFPTTSVGQLPLEIRVSMATGAATFKTVSK